MGLFRPLKYAWLLCVISFMFSQQIDLDALERRVNQAIETQRTGAQLFLNNLPLMLPANTPKEFRDIINSLSITINKVDNRPLGKPGFSITGTGSYKNQKIDVFIALIRKNKDLHDYIVDLKMPNYWKASTIFPKLEHMDQLTFPKAQVIFTTFNYKDPNTNVDIQAGLNLVAQLDLQGPLQVLGQLVKQKATFPPGVIITHDGPTFLTGIIAQNPANSEFKAQIPLRIGADFTKIKTVPTSFSAIFKNLVTDDFIVTVKALPEVSIQVGYGIRLSVAGQSNPITLRMIARARNQEISAAGTIANVALVPWFKLSQATLQLNWDLTLMALAAELGIPFTGIGIEGNYGIGTAPHRITTDMAGEFKLTSSQIPNFLVHGQVTNLTLMALIANLAQISGKPMPAQIPDLRITNAKLAFSPVATNIGERTYEPGITVEGDIKIQNAKGKALFYLDPNAQLLRAAGFVSPIRTKHIILTGAGTDNKLGTKDDGLSLDIYAPITNMKTARFHANGYVEIPALKLKHATTFDLTSEYVKAVIKNQIGNALTADIQLNISMINKGDFSAQFSFEQNVIKAIRQAIKKQTTTHEKTLTRRIGEIESSISSLSTIAATSARQIKDKAYQEIERIKLRLEILSKEIKEYERRCAKSKLKPFSSECSTLAVKKIEHQALQAYMKAASATGAKSAKIARAIPQATASTLELELLSNSAKSALGLLKSITKAVGQGLQIFEIKKLVGSTSSQELNQGKLPRITELIVSVNIPHLLNKTIILSDISFNFNDIPASIDQIAQSILEEAIKGV